MDSVFPWSARSVLIPSPVFGILIASWSDQVRNHEMKLPIPISFSAPPPPPPLETALFLKWHCWTPVPGHCLYIALHSLA
jgi:hypothetical protein